MEQQCGMVIHRLTGEGRGSVVNVWNSSVVWLYIDLLEKVGCVWSVYGTAVWYGCTDLLEKVGGMWSVYGTAHWVEKANTVYSGMPVITKELKL